MSRKQFAVNGSLADRVISVAHIIGRPVRNAAGTRIGRVSDIVVRWDAGNEHPPVTGVFVKVRGAFAVVQQADVTLTQTEIRLRSDARMQWRPVWGDDDVALARDVLDRQLVDTSGVQVVRAADVYLLNGPQGWELAGIDVGLLSFGRRLSARRRACPPPDRVIDWAPAAARSCRGSPTRPRPGSQGRRPPQASPAVVYSWGFGRPSERAARPGCDGTPFRSQPGPTGPVGRVRAPSPAAEALSQLDADHREALLAELDEPDRERLRALLEGHAG